MAGQDFSVDPRSGFCRSNRVFYSKRKPIPHPSDGFLDVFTYISSHHHRGRIALIDAATAQALTYPDLWGAVNSVAAGLSDLGIKQGDVVLLLSPNSIYFPIICLAIMSIGAIITTTNPLNTPREIHKQAADSKAKLAVTTPALVAKLGLTKLPVVLIGSDTKAQSCVCSLDDLMRSDPEKRPVVRIRQEDTATLLFSSGTTGASKGVATTHRNIIAMISVVQRRFSSGDLLTFLCTVPMFHIYGLCAFATGLLSTGSTIVVLSKFEIGEMLRAVQRYRVTHLPVVPPILMALGATEMAKGFDLGSVKTVVCGGAPLSKEATEAFTARFPKVAIMQGYGLTETSGIGASADTPEESRRYGTAGLLSPNMEAKVVDPDTGEALLPNQRGDLWLRGPSIMKGYFSNAEATAGALDSEGWLKTGDLCYFDEDGFLFVVDRLKELIKYKGYQVAPAELEALLLTHPNIEDAAVVPFPDKEAGQIPMAFVVRKAGSSLSEATLMEFVAAQVAPYKKIRRVAFVSAIPKNASGKTLRKDLISLATATAAAAASKL
ncbi:hypothetical protein AMTRI_Chr09g15550 [Amborella trichopoda]